jgi:hypothetical protein
MSPGTDFNPAQAISARNEPPAMKPLCTTTLGKYRCAPAAWARNTPNSQQLLCQQLQGRQDHPSMRCSTRQPQATTSEVCLPNTYTSHPPKDKPGCIAARPITCALCTGRHTCQQPLANAITRTHTGPGDCLPITWVPPHQQAQQYRRLCPVGCVARHVHQARLAKQSP